MSKPNPFPHDGHSRGDTGLSFIDDKSTVKQKSYLKEIIAIIEIHYTKSTLKYILIKKKKKLQHRYSVNLKNDTAIASNSGRNYCPTF